MSVLVIVLIVLAVLIVALFVGGLLASRRRTVVQSGDYERHVASADQALELARAQDRGWERSTLEEVARRAMAEQRPESSYSDLHLVLVDDRPGVEEDRAHFVAAGPDGDTRLVLARGAAGWSLERFE